MTSTIKVNTITTESGSTLTLGESGKTVTLASGASQSGFGRTGTVDWQTSIKTGDFTAANGEGYFVDTSSGTITVTLPSSPSAGNIVSIADYAKTFDTSPCTINRNSEPIQGETFNLVLGTEGQAVTLIYADGTKGWIPVNSNETVNEVKFIAASGGSEATSGDFKIHTFTGPGTFTVTCAGNAAGSNTVSYVVVAGGGGGGDGRGGGGGGGGYREGLGLNDSYTGSPLRAPVGVPVPAQSYPITVGGGGAGASSSDDDGVDGNASTFHTITSAGGGAGGAVNSGNPTKIGKPGGSGGGAGGTFCASSAQPGGTGNTPPVSPPQGNNGGNGVNNGPPTVPSASSHGATGGGAGGAGSPATGTPAPGQGGVGVPTSITGSPVSYSGGGGGASDDGRTLGSTCGTGGDGQTPSAPSTTKTGTVNRGGGGGGVRVSLGGGAGGSGVVIIRYKFQ